MRRLLSIGLPLAFGAVFLACATSTKTTASPPAAPAPDASAAAETDAGAEVPEEYRELDAFLAKSTKDYAFQSAAFGVIKGGALAFFHGYGVADEKRGTEVTRDTVYRVGSITKVMTGTVIVQLRDEGKLTLDDPLEKWLPDATKIVYPHGADDPRVTLGQILTHTSGMPRLGKVDYTGSDRDVTEEEVLGELDGLVLESVPGTQSVYSNLAVSMLGPVIARVTGQSYEEAMQQRLFDPLGMKSVWRREDVKGPLALGHIVNGKKTTVDPPHWRMGAMEAAGGLYTSIDDLFRFARFGLEGPQSGSTPLSLASLRDAETVHDGTHGRQGTGWIWVVTEILDSPFVWHNGSTIDYSSTMWLDPKNDVGFIGLEAASDSEQNLDGVAVAAMKYLVGGEALPTD